MSRSFRLGIFVLSTLGILSVSVFLIGRQVSRFGGTYRVRSQFDNVGGLSEGADVRVGGIRKGTVRSILLPKSPDGKITVIVDLGKETQAIVKHDSVAAIQSEGLLGDKFVEISFGSVESELLKDGDEIESKPPFEMSDLFDKANLVLDTSQGALEKIQGAADNLQLISSKINRGTGTLGKLVNDTALYQQAARGVAAVREDADALKHNFFLRGFFKDRGYTDPAEIKDNAISQLPTQQPLKRFLFDAKKLFDKPGAAKLRNPNILKEAGQYLRSETFGMVVVTTGTGRTGDSDKARALSEARSYVIRKYLVETFPLDDKRVKTLGLGKNVSGAEDGTVEILVYSNPPAAVKPPPR